MEIESAAASTSRSLTEWELCYHRWDAADQPIREALMTLGNGHFATRGAAEEVRAGGSHYPGTYLAGGYSRAKSEIAGEVIENEDLVNWPNWLLLSFRCEAEDWFALDSVSVLDYSQRLSLRDGVLSRHVHFRDRGGREFKLDSRRIVHMEDPHLAAIEWILTPLNWSGPIEILSAIDGRVENSGVERYRALNGRHLDIVHAGDASEEAVVLAAQTKQSRIVMAQAIRTRAWLNGAPATVERRTEVGDDWVGQHLSLACEAGKPLRVEKVLSLYGSRDFAISEPCIEACDHLQDAPNFAKLLERHELAWRKLWHRADLELGVEQGVYAQLVLRLHLFHILQTASMNTIGQDVGMPARGLHGEGYRGHIFWDELFTFPYLNLRIPELTRSLLLYRYRRLPRARRAAKQAGFAGAMFPWQSGSDGREESQVLQLNPKSGRWLRDNTQRQRHVNSAIAYNIWQYYQATEDIEFLSFYGAEMLLEIARFWSSIASIEPDRERYGIRGVVGPDEFHTRYPDTDSLGLDNNAYTNVMAAWALKTATAALDLLAEDRRQELLRTLGISSEELQRWDDISRRMVVPFHGEGIISQFEGWDELEELDWDALRERYGDIHRLDRLLEAEGRDVNRYQASKQADAMMLFFLFSAEELTELFLRLGYDFDAQRIPENISYYLARTSHGSTLSRVVHAWVLARTDRKHSWHLFQEALASDIDDVQGGTTPEGIHLGAMGGTVDLIQRCYTGIEIRDGVLWLNPQLPDGLRELKLCLRYRGHWLRLRVNHRTLNIHFEKGWSAPARIGFQRQVYAMAPGQQMQFELNEKRR